MIAMAAICSGRRIVRAAASASGGIPAPGVEQVLRDQH
jgi:hypothetical protein